MTPAQLRELERLAALAAENIANAKRTKRGERKIAAPLGPAPAERTVVRCVACNAPLWAANALQRANGDYACSVHVAAPLHDLTSARTVCAHCRETVASGVWRYGGTAFGHAWQRDAALCAPCGFGATDWLTLVRPELPKGIRKRMTVTQLLAWHAKHKPAAVRYVQWCRLLHDGREAAATFAASLQEALAPEPIEPLFDMSDPEGALKFLQRVGLAQ